MQTGTTTGYYNTAENTAGGSVTITTGTTSGYYSATTSNPYGWEPITVPHPIPETIPYTTDAHTISTIDGRIYTAVITDYYRGFFNGPGAASQPAERDEEEDIEVDSNAFCEFMGFDE